MLTTTIFATLVSLASARIVGFAVPATITPDSTIKVEILTENYIQAITDIAISFGISPANTSYPGALGSYLSTKSLGPDFSNILENITHYIDIPATTAKGDFVLQAAHFQLTGSSVSPDLESYAVNVTVGDVGSGEYVRSYRIDDQ